MTPDRAVATKAGGDGIDVRIARTGEAIDVDVDMRVDATPEEVWDVLTDYEHMARFVGNVVGSRIVQRAGDTLEVRQESRLKWGPFQLTFENERAIELARPVEIRTRLLRGDMKDSSFTTRIAADGAGTRVTNHGRFVPDRWIPPIIGTAVLEAETRKQFAEFKAEILRRKGGR